MKTYLKMLLFVCIGTTGFAQEFSDAYSIGPLNSGTGEIIGIEKSSSDVFVTGNWTGTYDIDPRGTANRILADDQGIFLARYDEDGELIWHLVIDGNDIDKVEDMAFLQSTSSDDGIYICGEYSSSTLLFPSSASSTTGTTLTNQGYADVFVAKYDLNGDLQWVQGFGSASNIYCTTIDVNLYNDGTTDKIKLAIGGYQQGIIGTDLDPSSAVKKITSQGGKDAWLAVYEEGVSGITYESAGVMGNDGSTIGGVNYSGTEGSHESIEALTLDYPNVYSSMTLKYNAAYVFDAQTIGTPCTTSPPQVLATFAYGYTTSPPTGSRGLIVKHTVNSCPLLQTNWVVDPIAAKSGLNTTESRYYDIHTDKSTQACGDVYFCGYQLTDYANDADREPQYGSISKSKTNLRLEELETVAATSNGGTFHAMDVEDGCGSPKVITLGGNSMDDLSINGSTTFLDDGEAFIVHAKHRLLTIPATLTENSVITFGTNHEARIHSIVYDENASPEEFLVAGRFNGTMDFASSLSITGSGTSPDMDPFWSKHEMNTLTTSSTSVYVYDLEEGASSAQIEITGVASPKNKDYTYVFGTFTNFALLDENILIEAKAKDAFLVKYDNLGEVEWYKHYTGDLDIISGDIICHSDGDVYVSGMFKATSTEKAILGDGSDYVSNGDFDGFVDKFEADGTYGWNSSQILGSTTEVNISDIEISTNGDYIYLTGYHYEDLNIDLTTIAEQASGTTPAQSAYVISLDASTSAESGTYQVATVNTTSASDAYGVRLDFHARTTAHYLALLINFTGELDNFTDPNSNAYSTSDIDAHVITLDHVSGSLTVDEDFGFFGSGSQIGKDLSFNNSTAFSADDPITGENENDIIVAIAFNTDLSFYDGTNTNTTNYSAQSTNPDLLLARFKTDGKKEWVNAIDIDADDLNCRLGISGHSILLMSEFESMLTQGSTSLSPTKKDLFYAIYGYDNGTYKNSSLTQVASDEDINLLGFDPDGESEFGLGGAFSDDISFPGITNPLPYLGSSSVSNAYFGKLDICNSSPNYTGLSTFSVCFGLVLELNHELFGGGNYHWYEEDGTTALPKDDPINPDYRLCETELIKGAKYWVQAVDDKGCKSAKVAITFTTISFTPVIQLVNPSAGSTLCGGSVGNSIQVTHATTYPAGYSIELQSPDGILGAWSYVSSCVTTAGVKCTFDIALAGDYRFQIIDPVCGVTKYSSALVIGSAFNQTITANITNPTINCPDDNNKDVILTASTGTGLTYQWHKGPGPVPTSGSLLSGETSQTLEDVVLDPNLGPNHYFCSISQGSCQLSSNTIHVNEHPQLKLTVKHPGGSVPSTFSLTDLDLTSTDAERKYGGRSAQDQRKDGWFYYQGREISHYEITGISPLLLPISYDDIITDAVAESKLPFAGSDYPGVYFLRTFPNCAKTVRVFTNPVTLTLDCSASSAPSGSTTISSNVTPTTPTNSYTSTDVYIGNSASPGTAIVVSAALSFTDCKVVISENLEIISGGSVSFENCEVRVEKSKEIIVYNGATGGLLEMDYTTTYSRPMNIMGCDLWKGITVKGDPTSASRGIVRISGQSSFPITVSGAEIAVFSEAGGLVEIEDAEFTNNHNDVAFSNYGSTHSSYITSSNFKGTLLDKSTNPPSSTYRFPFTSGHDYGNMAYLQGVNGITLENNSYIGPDNEILEEVMGGLATSEGVTVDDVDNVYIENSSWSGNHLKAMSAEASNYLTITDINASGDLGDGFYFEDCSNVEISESTGSSSFTYSGTQGLVFKDCEEVSIENTEIAQDLNGLASGIELDNSSDVTISECSFGPTSSGLPSDLSLAISASGASYQDLVISENTFLQLPSGVLIENGDDILISENTFGFMQTTNSMTLQYYGLGAIDIEKNTFHNNQYCIVVSPVENPLTVSGTNPPNRTKEMDLNISCNKFYDSGFGIIGSGNLKQAIGSASTGAENWFGNIGGLPPTPQGLAEWDILWQKANSGVAGTTNYNFVGSSCSLQVSGGTSYAGYTPNSNNGTRNPIDLNGTTFSSTASSDISLQDKCSTSSPNPIPATCYGSFKKGTSIDAQPELEALQVELFPNPTEGDLLIESNYDINQITVFDMNHRQVMTLDVDALKNAQLKTSGLSEGVYLVQISTADQIVIRRLVKF